MKILLVINQFGYGGAERQLLYLVKLLGLKGYHLHVCILTPGGDLCPELADSNVKLAILKKVFPRMDFTRIIKLSRLIKDIKPDIVHAFMFTANFYCAMVKIFQPFRLIVSERNAEPMKPLHRRFIEHFVFNSADAIISNSKVGADLLRERNLDRETDITVVPNGIDISLFQNLSSKEKIKKSFGIDNKASVVGIFGTIDGDRKNHEMFFRAIEKLNAIYSHPIVGLCVGGGPETTSARNFVRRMGLNKQVIFTGPRSDVPTLMSVVDVVVSTSRWEGMPNVIMEAMASGKPVVATAVGGTPELVIDGETGYLVKVDDFDEMASRIYILLTNPALAKKIGCAGKYRIAREFSLNNMVSKTIDVYDSVYKPCTVN